MTVPSRTLREEQPEHPGTSHVENILPHTGVNTLKTDSEAISCRQRAGGHQRAANQPQTGSASEQEQHRTVKTLKEGDMTLETVERTLQKDDKTVEGGGICPFLQWRVSRTCSR